MSPSRPRGRRLETYLLTRCPKRTAPIHPLPTREAASQTPRSELASSPHWKRRRYRPERIQTSEAGSTEGFLRTEIWAKGVATTHDSTSDVSDDVRTRRGKDRVPIEDERRYRLCSRRPCRRKGAVSLVASLFALPSWLVRDLPTKTRPILSPSHMAQASPRHETIEMEGPFVAFLFDRVWTAIGT
jgi:hypothetical protein